MNKFIIGIGSQRAGSTLLHRILDECTDIFMHPVKELHYYDSLYEIRSPNLLVEYSQRQLDREIDRLVSAKGYGYIDDRYKCYLRTNKILSKVSVKDVDYLDLYRPFVSKSEFLGEITPEYMILPEEGVSMLADELGAGTKIILLARNPADRFISAYKLLLAYSNSVYDIESFSDGLRGVFDSMPSWIEQQKELNSYQRAYEMYSRYFDSVSMLSYEALLQTPDVFVDELERYLEVTVDKDKARVILNTKVNALSETGVVDSDLKLKIDTMFESDAVYLEEFFKAD